MAAILAVLALVIVALAIQPARAAADPGSVTCDERAVPVRALSFSWTIAGTYCQPSDHSPKAVFVLVHGATYNRSYWDFGYRPEVYSFSRALGRAGYASLAIDQLGAGESSRPLSALVSVTVLARTVHQVVAYLRQTGFDGTRYDTVLLGGHSLGSMTSVVEAGSFRDVDGVLITGFTHRPDWLGVAQKTIAPGVHPAFLDPAFADEGLDPGYLTTRPGTRYELWHAPGEVASAVMVEDEETKDVMSATGFIDLPLSTLLPYSAAIDAPVLLVIGSDDWLFCGPPLAADCSTPRTLLDDERQLYAGAPCLDATVMRGVGHAINLHPSAPELQAEAIAWADSVISDECPQGP